MGEPGGTEARNPTLKNFGGAKAWSQLGQNVHNEHFDGLRLDSVARATKAALRSRLRRLGIAALCVPALQLLLGTTLPAHAGDGSAAADNTLILISSALVLLMTPGLAFFYGGFVQGRNVLNTMGMSLVMMGIGTLV